MFEKNLKYYRLQKNMSMKDLATAVGVTSMAISNYESGKRKPEIEIINKLAEVLGIKVVDFLNRRNSGLNYQHFEFRKNSTLTKGQQEYVRESVEEYFSRFFDAVEFLGGNPLPGPPESFHQEMLPHGRSQHAAVLLPDGFLRSAGRRCVRGVPQALGAPS